MSRTRQPTSRTALAASALGTFPGLALARAVERGLVSERVALAAFALSLVGPNLTHLACPGMARRQSEVAA